MIVSTYERKVVDDWRKHFSTETARRMLGSLRAEMPVDRFGLVRQSLRIDGRVVKVELPDWAKDARTGVIRIRKGLGAEVA